MREPARHRTTILTSPDEVPAAPSDPDAELLADSWSLVLPGVIRGSKDLTSAVREREDDSSSAYIGRLHDRADVAYGIGKPCRTTVGEFGDLRAIPTLLTSPSLPEVGLLLVGFRFSRIPGPLDNELDRPACVDDMLHTIARLTEPELASELFRAAARCFGSVTEEAEITLYEGASGVQLWNLGSTKGFGDGPYHGVRDSRRFAWELSAILHATSDHVRIDRLWRERASSQVFDTVRHGFTYLGDHMVFVSRDSCLEITHMNETMRQRSSHRLDTYGYDSSALFVWAVSLYRTLVASDLAHDYRELMLGGRDRDGGGHGGLRQAREHGSLLRAVKDRHALDTVALLGEQFIESRHVRLAEEFANQTGYATHLESAERQVARATEAMRERIRDEENTRERRFNYGLGIAAAGLASLSVPSFVGEIRSMGQDGDAASLAVTGIIFFMVIAGTAALGWWRGWRSSKDDPR